MSLRSSYLALSFLFISSLIACSFLSLFLFLSSRFHVPLLYFASHGLSFLLRSFSCLLPSWFLFLLSFFSFFIASFCGITHALFPCISFPFRLFLALFAVAIWIHQRLSSLLLVFVLRFKFLSLHCLLCFRGCCLLVSLFQPRQGWLMPRPSECRKRKQSHRLAWLLQSARRTINLFRTSVNVSVNGSKVKNSSLRIRASIHTFFFACSCALLSSTTAFASLFFLLFFCSFSFFSASVKSFGVLFLFLLFVSDLLTALVLFLRVACPLRRFMHLRSTFQNQAILLQWTVRHQWWMEPALWRPLLLLQGWYLVLEGARLPPHCPHLLFLHQRFLLFQLLLLLIHHLLLLRHPLCRDLDPFPRLPRFLSLILYIFFLLLWIASFVTLFVLYFAFLQAHSPSPPPSPPSISSSSSSVSSSYATDSSFNMDEAQQALKLFLASNPPQTVDSSIALMSKIINNSRRFLHSPSSLLSFTVLLCNCPFSCGSLNIWCVHSFLVVTASPETIQKFSQIRCSSALVQKNILEVPGALPLLLVCIHVFVLFLVASGAWPLWHFAFIRLVCFCSLVHLIACLVRRLWVYNSAFPLS